MYARVHAALVEQPLPILGALLSSAQLLFALTLLLAGSPGEHWHLILYQLVGAGAIGVAIQRHRTGASGDHFLIMAGSLAGVYFLYTFALPLGMLAVLVWGLVFVISFVT